MNKEHHLKEIARQLGHPEGENGLLMADMMHETNIGMTRHAIQQLQLQQSDIILELGHGNGKHVPEILAQHSSIKYYGLEVSQLMYEKAVSTNSHLYPTRAFFDLYDGQHIPYKDSFFTKIFTVNTLYFWQSPISMLKEIYRVLKPRGTFSLTFTHKSFMESLPFTKWNFKLYDLAELKELVEGSPFAYTSEETMVEQIKNKNGDMVNRTFTTINLSKITL